MESKGDPDKGAYRQSWKETAPGILGPVVSLFLPVVIIVGGISYELTGFGLNVWSSEDNSTTTVARDQRGGWEEFLYVVEHSELDRDNCDRFYDGDLDVCYYELGDVFVDSGIYQPHEWWPLSYKVLTEGPSTTSSTTTSTTTRPRPTRLPPTREYQSNQYGCHDDGRCLDDYDTWCEEDEYYPDEECP